MNFCIVLLSGICVQERSPWEHILEAQFHTQVYSDNPPGGLSESLWTKGDARPSGKSVQMFQQSSSTHHQLFIFIRSASFARHLQVLLLPLLRCSTLSKWLWSCPQRGPCWVDGLLWMWHFSVPELVAVCGATNSQHCFLLIEKCCLAKSVKCLFRGMMKGSYSS